MQAVVGLGGSAGSTRALQTFFFRMPGDSGLALVVVLHLSPQYESSLAGICCRNRHRCCRIKSEVIE
jgi:two-component system CheB/CheR fusion protein